ncbi:MAG TPA: hypothetical protein IAA75_04975 [Candidatus Pullichristensenella avicola]|nr:hypothetical protein [Candidatus Pullichristensenella avicola]
MALIEFEAFSDALGKAFSAQIALPETDRGPFAVLWLLHGACDDETGWFRNTAVERLATRRDLAVVAPAAGMSMYEDMAHGQRYFTHIADELPAMLRRMLPLSARREDNFIAGLSMGGMGALKIAMRRPQNYEAVCCLSAGHTNYRFHEPKEDTPRFNRYFIAYGERGPLPAEEETLKRARALAAGGPCPRVWHVCGAQDGLRGNAHLTRDFFLGLSGNPFQYEYHEYPGRHNWEFWEARVPEMLDFLLRAKAEAHP